MLKTTVQFSSGFFVGIPPGWPSPKAPSLVQISPTTSTKNKEVQLAPQNTLPALPFFVPALSSYRLHPQEQSPTKASLSSRPPPPDFERRTPLASCLSLPPLLPPPRSLQKSLFSSFSPVSYSRVIRADGFIARSEFLIYLATEKKPSSIK